MTDSRGYESISCKNNSFMPQGTLCFQGECHNGTCHCTSSWLRHDRFLLRLDTCYEFIYTDEIQLFVCMVILIRALIVFNNIPSDMATGKQSKHLKLVWNLNLYGCVTSFACALSLYLKRGPYSTSYFLANFMVLFNIISGYKLTVYSFLKPLCHDVGYKSDKIVGEFKRGYSVAVVFLCSACALFFISHVLLESNLISVKTHNMFGLAFMFGNSIGVFLIGPVIRNIVQKLVAFIKGVRLDKTKTACTSTTQTEKLKRLVRKLERFQKRNRLVLDSLGCIYWLYAFGYLLFGALPFVSVFVGSMTLYSMPLLSLGTLEMSSKVLPKQRGSKRKGTELLTRSHVPTLFKSSVQPEESVAKESEVQS